METCQNVNVKIFSTELLTSIPLRLLGHLYIASFRWRTCFASLGRYFFLKSALCNAESPSQGLVITLGALLLVIFVAVDSLRHSTRTKRSGPLAWGGVTVQFSWRTCWILEKRNLRPHAPPLACVSDPKALVQYPGSFSGERASFQRIYRVSDDPLEKNDPVTSC